MDLKQLMIGLLVVASSPMIASSAMAQQQPMTAQTMDSQLDGLYGTHEIYHHFFDALKDSIIQRHKDQVAAVIRYPLIVQLNKKQVKIKNKQQFIKHYDQIITPKIEQVVKEQQYVGMLSTYRGMAFGNGEIWFAGLCPKKTCKDHSKTVVKIIGINNFMQ
ncbi:hypothetical protein CIN_18100 [Commensalibacter intestini A911]|uniref:Uncharacterized protein n=2 Tax=Commensalibacter intestini TaxID=479936 RepID=A0A251ZTW7_9PROT|nr:hypothetical protein [Commensalibacter intestini]EHD13618.1 hypothetical protein CIN_18100 [Commensalibacter intestini A911]OUI78104.1 hypothetical protein HK18_11250 [Commensalibacter intestini]